MIYKENQIYYEDINSLRILAKIKIFRDANIRCYEEEIWDTNILFRNLKTGLAKQVADYILNGSYSNNENVRNYGERYLGIERERLPTPQPKIKKQPYNYLPMENPDGSIIHKYEKPKRRKRMNTATNVNRHIWTESQEKSLLEAVKFIEDSFRGSDARFTLSALGGKWFAVSSWLKKNAALEFTEGACESRYRKIKTREQHKVTDDGQLVVLLNKTEFPQINDDDVKIEQDNSYLLDRLTSLEGKVASLELETNKLKILNNKLIDIIEAHS